MVVFLIPVLLSYNFVEDGVVLLLTALLILLAAEGVSLAVTHSTQYILVVSQSREFPREFPLYLLHLCREHHCQMILFVTKVIT